MCFLMNHTVEVVDVINVENGGRRINFVLLTQHILPINIVEEILVRIFNMVGKGLSLSQQLFCDVQAQK